MMKILKLTYAEPNEGYLKNLVKITEKNTICRMGTCIFKAGDRLPEKGLKANPEHEISIILEGSLKGITETEEKILKAGDIVMFKPNEMQAGEILEDCKILWILFK